jgi:hypothetical protein
MARRVDNRPLVPEEIDLGSVDERITGSGGEVESAPRHLSENDNSLKTMEFTHQQPARLRNPFDDERIGHDPVAGEMIVHVRFTERDVLDSLRVLLTNELGESVDPEPTHGNRWLLAVLVKAYPGTE